MLVHDLCHNVRPLPRIDTEVLPIQPESKTKDDFNDVERSDSDEEVEACSEDGISLSESSETSDDGLELTNSSQAPALKGCIAENVSDLLRYAALIRQYSRNKTGKRSDLYSPPGSDDDSSDVDNHDERPGTPSKPSLSHRFASHVDTVLMREFGPERIKDPVLAYLRERLRVSVIRRWRRICYRRAHAEHLGALSRVREEDPTVVPDLSEFGALFDPPVPQQSSQSETEEGANEAKSGTVKSVISAATTLESKFSFTRRPAVRTNTTKSASRVGGTDLSLPPIPRSEQVGTDYVYDCPYCGRLPIVQKPLGRQTWK